MQEPTLQDSTLQDSHTPAFSKKQPLEADRDISVAICSHNRSGMLKIVLESLADQTFPAERFEVVVTDDASSDDTQAMLQSIRIPYRLVNVRHEVNRGITAARNTCLLHSRGRVIIFVDDDVICHQQLLEEHWNFQTAHPRCICNGWVNHVAEPKRPSCPKLRLEDLSNGYFWTSNVSVRREYLFQVGLFDENFIEYGYEDKDMGMMLKAIGIKSRKHMKAIGFHVKPPMQRKHLESHCRRAVTLAHTALIYVRKHRTLRSRLSTGIIFFPWLTIHRLTKIGNWLENLCLKRLNRPALHMEDKLCGIDRWCAERLSKIYYYDEVLRYLCH